MQESDWVKNRWRVGWTLWTSPDLTYLRIDKWKKPKGKSSIPPAKISCITVSSSITSPAADVAEPSLPRPDKRLMATPSTLPDGGVLS